MPDFSNLGDRIKICVAEIGSYDKLSAKTGIPVRTLSNYAAGLNDIKSNALIEIARAANKSIEWLATGEESLHSNQRSEGSSSTSLVPAGGQDVLHVPVLNIAASAGGGAAVLDEGVNGYIAFNAAWLRANYHLNPAALFSLPTIGESMEPTIKAGEFLLCSNDDPYIKPGDGIYVIRLEGDILVKRLQRLPGGKIKISSDNKTYESYEITLNDGVDFAILGKVVLVHGLRRV